MQTRREIVAAQIDHIETGFVPYRIDFDKDAAKKMDDHFGNGDWRKEIVPCIDFIDGTFDTWDNMKPIDPQRPDRYGDPYGSTWIWNDTIASVEHPILEKIPLEEYRWPTLEDFWWPEKEQGILKRALEDNGQYKVGSIGAGWYELSWRLTGVEEALMMMVSEPEEYEEIVEGLDRLLNQFTDTIVKLPFDAIMLFDDWSDQRGCIMGTDRWRRFYKERLARIYEKIHRAGKKVVNHVCGSVAPLIPDLIEIGLDVLESCQPEADNMNPYELKRKYGDKLAFWGGLGVQQMVPYGTPDEIRHEIRRLRTEMSAGGGYILASSKELNRAVPVENLLAVYETVTEENWKLTAG